jgi:hypothetical protein
VAANSNESCFAGERVLSSGTLFKRGAELTTDINSSEMREVDVETLMGLISRRVNGPPDARHIMGEIERARLKADSIVTGRISDSLPKDNGDARIKVDETATPRPVRRGWKSKLKGMVVLLIMRAVRTNFRYQQVFNNAVIGVLQLMAEDLYAYERRLDAAGQEGRDESTSLPRTSSRKRRRARTPLRTRRTSHGFRRSRH